ncbi:MinD/ParA family ATP-binding protein [Halorientalis salina]|uniref:MinD/ParA family ATP-binding protein n=1 Tax=Halorientalis salina TaxID=2932266 RepID=UPI00145E0F64|nr:MinD/ParA family protein [Halorientalis salina]
MGETVYAIAAGKGGVGKTTTAVNLGVVLAQGGQTVVVVDADLAMTNLGQRLGIDHEPGIQQVLAGDAPVRDAVVKGPAGLAVVAGDRRLESFAAADPSELSRVLDLLSVAYDVVLVDTGPGVQRDTVVTYREADGVVLVTTPSAVAIEDANRTADMAADADCQPIGTVVTMADGDTDPGDIDGLDAEPLAVVPTHETGGPITASRPASDAAGAYRTLAAALPGVDSEAVVPDEPVPDSDDSGDSDPVADDDGEDTVTP